MTCTVLANVFLLSVFGDPTSASALTISYQPLFAAAVSLGENTIEYISVKFVHLPFQNKIYYVKRISYSQGTTVELGYFKVRNQM